MSRERKRNAMANEAHLRKDTWINQVEMSYGSNDVMNCKSNLVILILFIFNFIAMMNGVFDT